MRPVPEMLQQIANSALDAGEDPLALANRLMKKWPTMDVKNAINSYQWNHAGPSGPGVLVRGGSMSSRHSLLGQADFDLIFGESEGSAYEKEVELQGDDLGAGWVASTRAPSPAPAATPGSGWRATPVSSTPAPAPTATWNPTPTSVPPPAGTSSPLPTRSLTPAELSESTSSMVMPNFAALRANMAAPSSSLTNVLSPQMLIDKANQAAMPQQSQNRRRHRHHGQGQGQGQGQYGQGRYGQQSQYGAPGAGMVNTTWPPPAPANLLPGAPWPPPGAAPGSDLSSFYPVGTPQASSAYWNSSQVSLQQPQYSPATALPMDVYVDNPSYSTLGLSIDAWGKTEIVNMPRPHGKQRAQRPRAATMGAIEMGAADHKFDVIALRAKLRRIGVDVSKNGSVDQPLADAVNGIFKGWSDAPKGLQAGDMTTKGLKDHIKLVNKLVDQAVGGAQHLEHAENDE